MKTKLYIQKNRPTVFACTYFEYMHKNVYTCKKYSKNGITFTCANLTALH